jgi:hypothetical protein
MVMLGLARLQYLAPSGCMLLVVVCVCDDDVD